MTGFRQKIFNDVQPILDKMFSPDSEPERLTTEEWQLIREAWECSRTGNILCEALDEVGLDMFYVRTIVSAREFLTKREFWHTARARSKKIRIYRGCTRKELNACKVDEQVFGASWTLSKDIAEFFARRANTDAVVVAAELTGIDAWLDTSEHEIVATQVRINNIVSIEPAPTSIVTIDWNARPTLTPRDNCIA